MDPDALDTLSHEPLEAQLAALSELSARLVSRGADRQARESARAVMRYFDSSGMQHHRDEDEDLFPLLRQLAADRGRPEVAAVIGGLEREHAVMGVLWSRLRPQLEAVARGRRARLDSEDVARFTWLYGRHIEQEAAAVLPFAREALSAEQRAALGARMAARRA